MIRFLDNWVQVKEKKMENSFVMLGQFQKQARRAGMPTEKIQAYIKDATSGDREHLEEVLFTALSEIEGD